MADVGMSDVLSIMKENIASERESRLGEMQLALSALQYESERQFREEGRQREDVLLALETANIGISESLQADSDSGITKLVQASINQGLLIPDDTKAGAFSLKYKKAPESMSEELANQIHALATTYYGGEKEVARREFQGLASRVSSDYSDLVVTRGVMRSDLIASLEKMGVLYGGEMALPVDESGNVIEGAEMVPTYDPLRLEESYDVYTGVAHALDMLEKVEAERIEIGRGDYQIQRAEIFSPQLRDEELSLSDAGIAALATRIENLDSDVPGAGEEGGSFVTEPGLVAAGAIGSVQLSKAFQRSFESSYIELEKKFLTDVQKTVSEAGRKRPKKGIKYSDISSRKFKELYGMTKLQALKPDGKEKISNQLRRKATAQVLGKGAKVPVEVAKWTWDKVSSISRLKNILPEKLGTPGLGYTPIAGMVGGTLGQYFGEDEGELIGRAAADAGFLAFAKREAIKRFGKFAGKFFTRHAAATAVGAPIGGAGAVATNIGALLLDAGFAVWEIYDLISDYYHYKETGNLPD